MDNKGNHRIIVAGQVGESAMYAHVATLKVGEQLYMAVTDYYSGISIPTETVLAVLPMETERKVLYSVFTQSKPPCDCSPFGHEPTCIGNNPVDVKIVDSKG